MVTSKLNLFDTFQPYTVGWERHFDRLHGQVGLQSQGFPPYNIRKEDNFIYAIEMALAGFSSEDIEVELADGVLSVRSIKENDTDDKTLHRGISYRKFKKSFTLADDIVVNSAKLENGRLTIECEQIVPEEKKPRTIKVE